MFRSAKNKSSLISLFSLTLLIGCAFLAVNVFLGDLNQDEGWYLYAARMVQEGSMPYRDFAYTQTPVLPYVYSFVAPLVGKYGLAAGRLFTAGLSVICALLAAALASRLAQREDQAEAALLTLILILVNVYHSYFNALVKTYALTGVFLTAGFLALCSGLCGQAGRHWPSRTALFFASVLFVLAAGTRSSAGVVLPIVFVFLCIEGESRSAYGWFWFGLGGAVAACAVFLPFIIAAWDGFWFCSVAYHTLRESGGFWSGMVYKAGFFSRLLQAYFVPITLCLAAVFMIRGSAGCAVRIESEEESAPSRHSGRNDRRSGVLRSRLKLLIWICVAGVTVVHLLAPFPYDDYQVFVFPLFAVGTAAVLTELMQRSGRQIGGLLAIVFVINLAAAVSSPINQDWFVQGRDRIWWRIKEQAPLSKLRETASLIQSMARPGDLLLTQDPYLAVESGMRLPRGMEMGQFCYFPDFDDDAASKYNVLNRDGMLRLLRECDAPVAALSGYAFAISSPQVESVSEEDQAAFWAEVNRSYAPVEVVPDFGQAFTSLRIFRKNEP